MTTTEQRKARRAARKQAAIPQVFDARAYRPTMTASYAADYVAGELLKKLAAYELDAIKDWERFQERSATNRFDAMQWRSNDAAFSAAVIHVTQGVRAKYAEVVTDDEYTGGDTRLFLRLTINSLRSEVAWAARYWRPTNNHMDNFKMAATAKVLEDFEFYARHAKLFEINVYA